MSDQIELLHYWRSSCSWRVRWALAIKGISYKSTPINLLKEEQKIDSYTANNPSAFVPTIKINGESLAESGAILEWLEEVYPTPAILPQDSLSRIKVRQLALTIIAGTQPIQNPAVLKTVSSSPEARQEFGRHWIANGLAVYEKLLERGNPGTYSFGSTVTMADLCLIPQVYNANRFNVDMSQFPLISGINQRCLATKECDTAAPHNQPGAS